MSFKTKDINKGKNINSQQSDAFFLAATDSVKTPIIYIIRRKGQKNGKNFIVRTDTYL